MNQGLALAVLSACAWLLMTGCTSSNRHSNDGSDAGLDSGHDADAAGDADMDANMDVGADSGVDSGAKSGDYLWHTFYGSSNEDIDRSIASDVLGNLYITGTSKATWDGPNGEKPLKLPSGLVPAVFVLKLDANGNYQWHTFYGSNTSGFMRSLALDASGNMYITGTSEASWNGPNGKRPLHEFSGTWENLFILKLDTNGTYQWHTFYGSNASSDSRALALDASGNVYLTGRSSCFWNGPDGESPLHEHSGSWQGDSGVGSSDIFILKLDSSGQYQWHTFYGCGDDTCLSHNDIGYEIAVDANANLYVAGFSSESWNGPDDQPPLHAHSGRDDIAILKLDSSGTYQWHTFYGFYDDDDDTDDSDSGYALAVNSSGNLFVTGHSPFSWNGPGGESPLATHSGADEIFVLKLDSNGEYQWHTFYGGTSYDHSHSIVLNASGNLYVTGYSNESWSGPKGENPKHEFSGYNDLFILKLDKDGGYQWHSFYGSNASIYAYCIGHAIAVDGIGNLYVTGYSNPSWNGPGGESPLHTLQGMSDIVVIKMRQ